MTPTIFHHAGLFNPKILRTIYVNSMWIHATDQNCIKLRPENCGWLFITNGGEEELLESDV